MTTLQMFKNRTQAGKLLAERLSKYAGQPGVLVLALPRGGVPVGYEVAKALGAELDVLLVRKLGLPGHEEYAMGAVGSGGVRVINPDLLESGIVSPATIEAVTARELREIERRDRLYRGGRPPPQLAGRTVIIVDDGIATGSTMQAAVALVRKQHPARVVVAVPVGAPDSLEALAPQVDELVCLMAPPYFQAVGQWYRHFDQTSDEEVQDLLARAWREQPSPTSAIHPPPPTARSTP
jgi:putative phosphoribosyl transferase